jgi:hypothetical protein
MKSQWRSYIWTLLVGLVFLLAALWQRTFRDSFGEIFLILFLGACLIVSTAASLGLAVAQRTREALLRVALNGAFLLLFWPTLDLGRFLSDQLFLKHLTRFQQVTDVLLRNEEAKYAGRTFTDMLDLPAAYSNLHVKEKVQIRRTEMSTSVLYLNRDSSALGHSGYMYRSDDDPGALRKDYPKMGYTRLAPHWFYFLE